MKKKKICFFTGSRAEYGLLRPLMNKVKKEPSLRIQLVVTGTHLSPEFGLTYKTIEGDGFIIDEKVENVLSSDTPASIIKAMGLSLISLATIFDKLDPDIVVLLGDRYEMLSAAIAALIDNRAIAHIHGGERTEGAMDEAFRHAITKMSHIHFAAHVEYKKRIIQMGECPETVFCVGALGLDAIKKSRLLSKKELELELEYCFGKKNILVTYHSTTLDKNMTQRHFQELLIALDAFKDIKVIFTKTNADTNGRIINKMIDQYVSQHLTRSTAFTSLGNLRYYSMLKYVDAVAGNSSSGIIEAPSFKIPTINIGERQKGRIRAKSVIDCKPASRMVKSAIRKVYDKNFIRQCKTVRNPFGTGNTADKIVKIIKKQIIPINIKKEFYDLDTLCKK